MYYLLHVAWILNWMNPRCKSSLEEIVQFYIYNAGAEVYINRDYLHCQSVCRREAMLMAQIDSSE